MAMMINFLDSFSFLLLFFLLKMNVIIIFEFERHYNEVLNVVLNEDIKIEVIALKLYSGIID